MIRVTKMDKDGFFHAHGQCGARGDGRCEEDHRRSQPASSLGDGRP
jgi:hypothetical protein